MDSKTSLAATTITLSLISIMFTVSTTLLYSIPQSRR